MWSVGYNGTVRSWATDDWSVTTAVELPGDGTPRGIAASRATGEVAVARDHGVSVLDPAGELLAAHETSIKGISSPLWSEAGDVLCVGGADGKIRIYER